MSRANEAHGAGWWSVATLAGFTGVLAAPLPGEWVATAILGWLAVTLMVLAVLTTVAAPNGGTHE